MPGTIGAPGVNRVYSVMSLTASVQSPRTGLGEAIQGEGPSPIQRGRPLSMYRRTQFRAPFGVIRR
jgi:hypothetical protein